jgi:Raf kinase inhibitor-like YbhB/YbcL family protein
VVAALTLVPIGLQAASGADDRDLRPPSADHTTTTAAPVAPTDAVGTNTGVTMQLTSPAFAPGGLIPDRHSCRGDDVSPTLQWSNLPAGVTELAVVMVDQDAGGFVHWIVTGIPPTTGGLEEGRLPTGTVEGANDFGVTGWRGPCPPSGEHHYEFRLLALSGPAGITPNQEAQQAAEQIAALPTLASAILVGTFIA